MNTYHAKHTNTTDRYQVVGNHETVISSHDTRQEAINQLNMPAFIEDTPYGILEVISPGETTEGTMQLGCTEEQLKVNSLTRQSSN